MKQIASDNAATGNTIKVVVRVHIGRRQIVILPDHDIEIDIVAADEELAVSARDGLVNVQKVKRSQTIGPVSAIPSFSI